MLGGPSCSVVNAWSCILQSRIKETSGSRFMIIPAPGFWDLWSDQHLLEHELLPLHSLDLSIHQGSVDWIQSFMTSAASRSYSVWESDLVLYRGDRIWRELLSSLGLSIHVGSLNEYRALRPVRCEDCTPSRSLDQLLHGDSSATIACS